MALAPKKEVGLIAAALVLDNARGDGEITHVKDLGYSGAHPAVLTAAHMLHDLCEAGNDPAAIFSKEISEFHRMEKDGGLALHRAALRETQVARNQPCPCGSGKKYKKCCYWKEGLPEKPKGKAGKMLAALMTMLAGARDDQPN